MSELGTSSGLAFGYFYGIFLLSAVMSRSGFDTVFGVQKLSSSACATLGKNLSDAGNGTKTDKGLRVVYQQRLLDTKLYWGIPFEELPAFLQGGTVINFLEPYVGKVFAEEMKEASADYWFYVFNNDGFMSMFLSTRDHKFTRLKRRILFTCVQSIAYFFFFLGLILPPATAPIINYFIAIPMQSFTKALLYYIQVCPCIQTGAEGTCCFSLINCCGCCCHCWRVMLRKTGLTLAMLLAVAYSTTFLLVAGSFASDACTNSSCVVSAWGAFIYELQIVSVAVEVITSILKFIPCRASPESGCLYRTTFWLLSTVFGNSVIFLRHEIFLLMYLLSNRIGSVGCREGCSEGRNEGHED